MALSRPFECAGLGEMCDGPADSVDQYPRATARDHLALIVLAEVEQLYDRVPDVRGAVLVAVFMKSEDWAHQRLKVRNRHGATVVDIRESLRP
jgi:hypothetical protein